MQSLAEERAERLSSEFAQARAEGLRAARREIDEAIAAQTTAREAFDRAAGALDRAARSLDAHDRQVTGELEHAALRLAVGIAEEILGRELRACDDVVQMAIARALQLVPDRGTIVLRVHPDDVTLAAASVTETPGVAERVELLPDPSVEAGGCLAAVGPLRIDAQIGPALERVRSALLG